MSPLTCTCTISFKLLMLPLSHPGILRVQGNILSVLLLLPTLPHPSYSLTTHSPSLRPLPFLSNPPLPFFPLPTSFLHSLSLSLSLLLLGHFLPFLRVTLHELFTFASQWEILLCFQIVYSSKTQNQRFSEKGGNHVSFICEGHRNRACPSYSHSLTGC